MIVVNRILTGDDSDVLLGTDLAQIPGFGQVDLFVASSQNDTILSVSGPGGEPVAQSIRVQQRTNGIPNQSDDTPFSFGVVQGGKYRVNVDIVTAATVGLTAIYREAGVDF